MKRSAILDLPENVQQELNARLMAGGFQNYQGLADWLKGQGYNIAKSSVHRYGQSFEERCQALKMATAQAQTLNEVAPDDAGVMGDALTRLAQEKLFGLLMDLEDADVLEVLPRIGRVVAELGRAQVGQKKLQLEVRAKAKAVAAEVEKQIKKEAPGLSPTTIDTIRREILGIAS